ncbi:hypothetical protein D081_1608 [Anaerovibrio sp. JC8]|uniref:CYTH domain-containing protein n=1 Tax=Anaerovibrio sp. JC8 TaxID=1240085 RepID=UPI000A0CC497|nr:CYTH domain-containing protein [Anaerovibrio sp. JC8]ORT99724.1 hypothetical protein D081_1608 [Anaerovibrio sp. JC8]
MAVEIERKFLINEAKWQPVDEGVNIRQGYLCTDKERTVRVRTKGNKGYLTIKGQTEGLSRLELEYEIPLEEATQLLDNLCHRPLIEKTRHIEEHLGHIWEIDVFFGDNEGLIVAEVELSSEEEEIDLPDWIVEEVSHDKRYYNSCLSQKPYTTW